MARKAKTGKVRITWLGWAVIVLIFGLLSSCFGGDEEESAPVTEPKESVAAVEQFPNQDAPEIDEPVEIEVEKPLEESTPVEEVPIVEETVVNPETVEEPPVVEEPDVTPIPKPSMSVQQSSKPEEENSVTVYVTKTGKRYHYDGTCGNGEYIPSTLEKAESYGLTPCQKCVG